MMKRKIAAFLMFFVLTFLALGIGVSAEESIYERNIRKINEGVYSLGDIMDGYAAKDTSDTKTVAIRTNAVIVRYANRINDLRANEQIGSEDLSGAVELLILKGELSGECAWIFESHADELSAKARERALSVYESTISAIDASASGDELVEMGSSYIREVILSIYEEKALALCDSNDSVSVRSIAEAAMLEMRGLSTADCEDYERVLKKAENAMRAARYRECAIVQFATAYERINGEGSFERNKASDENISYFLYLVSEADTVASFNMTIESSILSVLEEHIGDARGDYVGGVLREVEYALSVLQSDANKASEIMDAAELFEGISGKISVADKKDSLVRYALEKLGDLSSAHTADLLDEYNRVGGVFDICADERELEFSLKQAKLRVDWCAECNMYKTLSESFFKDANGEIKTRFDELYFTVDSEMGRSLTLERARDAMRAGRSLAEALCFEFEAQGYILEFSEMIEMPLGNITRINITDLRQAILGYDALSASARGMIDEEIFALCIKYRAALADYLYYIASGDGDMHIALEYATIIDGTAFSGNAERFVAFCEVLIKKAGSEMRICEIFKGIIAREGYAAFSDKYKNAIRECRDVYLRRVKDMPLDRTAPDAELGVIIASAELEMLRVYAEAVISSFAALDDSEAVSEIISSALSELRFADSTEELDGAVVRAELDVYRQRAKEMLDRGKIRTLGSLELLEYLGVEKKSGYREDLNTLVECAFLALDACGELKAAIDVFDVYEAQFLEIYERARTQDLSAAKSWASTNVIERGDRVVAELENMRYIDSDECYRLINTARDARTLALRSIELCASVDSVLEILSAYESELDAIESAAARRELECAREASFVAASGRSDDVLAKLDALSYVSGTLIERIKSDISDDLEALNMSFESAQRVAVVESNLDEFIAALAETERAAMAEELDSAIAELSRSLRAMRAEVMARIAETKYLSAEVIVECSARLGEICDAVLAQLSSAEAVFAAEQIWQSASAECGELITSLERDELLAAREQSVEALRGTIDESLTRIGALVYLGEGEKSELRLELEDMLWEFSSLAERDGTCAEIEARFSDCRQKIKSLEQSAKQKNLVSARAYYTSKLDAEFGEYRYEDYTSERYELIKEAYDIAFFDITMASDVDRIAELYLTAERSMAAVVSIFEDRRAELIRSVNEVYSELLKMSAQYSADALASLAKIKSGALDALSCASRDSGLAALDEIADGAIAAMRAVKLDWISTGNIGADSSGFAEYPAGYDHFVGGAWGVVENKDGLPSDVRLSISLTQSNNFYKRALREALKESRIGYVGDFPMSDAEIYSRLDGLVIKGIFSIKLIRSSAIYDEFSGEYTVRILLPRDMRSERTLRVVYISPSGDAEYYDALCDGGMLVFKTTHFSDFLVLGERQMNLLPIIAILAVIGVLEGLLLTVTKARLNRRLIRLRVVSPAPLAALWVIAPRGGIAMLVTLVLIDISLGVLIFVDLRELRKKRRDVQFSKMYTLPTDFSDNSDEDTDEIPQIKVSEEHAAAFPAYFDRVSAQDADSLISDSKASALILRSERAPEVCRGCKKTFINVDTLSEHFARGECVSIRSLKEKGLVPMSACYIKVLARGVIDKPLTVKAQSFSANAVKMITLTGGSAILEGSDIE